ncbi:Lrp/AsnC family transcriptional regulator [Agrococcus jejuensis]|uniref:Transcriptional regulator, AsnC family n=1 Tax=Agrococcus jejuensis TaxID=399736 RepID=A0A1G8EFG5_9MICO|nr:Lrp/AsnC family transcriptional regulator [Agrococcus jejuensis]SDH68672.1 transcriptional regulator, AsnC family [Agrococcus jejuensis]
MADETTDTPLRSFAERIRPATPEVPLDAIDVQLLMELAKDARVPQRALADVLGMSSPAVADRIARLKAKGVIRGFSVDIDWEALGHSTVAYLSIKAAVGFDQSRVFETLMGLRGVEEINVVTGANDMVVKIRAHGFDDLRQILANDVWGIPGVQQTETSIVLVRAEPEGVDARMLQALLPSDD